MSDQGIKSTPQYQRLEIDLNGRRHLLVTDAAEMPDVAFAPGTSAAAFDERWTIAGDSRAIPTPGGHRTDHAFRSCQHLLIALQRRLSEERMGFRLYAIGTEPFLWSVYGAAEAFGLGRTEIRLFAHGSRARRVYCNHCRTITESVTTNIVKCTGCAAHLFVRDHFSRRLNAYAGVQVDAEAPGEIPPVEELYA